MSTIWNLPRLKYYFFLLLKGLHGLAKETKFNVYKWKLGFNSAAFCSSSLTIEKNRGCCNMPMVFRPPRLQHSTTTCPEFLRMFYYLIFPKKGDRVEERHTQSIEAGRNQQNCCVVTIYLPLIKKVEKTLTWYFYSMSSIRDLLFWKGCYSPSFKEET